MWRCFYPWPQVHTFRFRDFRLKPSTENLSQISHIDETWFSYPFPEEDAKNINHKTHPMSSADINIFSLEISNYYYV